MADAIVLAEGRLGASEGKTANGLVLHSMKDRITAVIDSTNAGKDAGMVVAGRTVGIPVVASYDEAARLGDPTSFYVGAAPVGGRLPAAFRDAIQRALEDGMTVYSGLHTFLSDDTEFAGAAARHGGRIVDVRKPPADLRVADGRVYDVKIPRVLIMGTDCAVGKRMTVVEMVNAARGRGINAGFVATGQTGCMLGPDAGCVIDRVPSDFCAGMVESMVCDVAAQGRSPIFVYGQASILHPAYAGVALSILHGTAPHAIVLQVDPVRKQRALFQHPRYTIGPVQNEIELIERLGTGKVVAIAVNGKDTPDMDAACHDLAKRTGRPTYDPFKHGAEGLLDAVFGALESQGFAEAHAVKTVKNSR